MKLPTYLPVVAGLISCVYCTTTGLLVGLSGDPALGAINVTIGIWHATKIPFWWRRAFPRNQA